jgi:hypothetical protein
LIRTNFKDIFAAAARAIKAPHFIFGARISRLGKLALLQCGQHVAANYSADCILQRHAAATQGARVTREKFNEFGEYYLQAMTSIFLAGKWRDGGGNSMVDAGHTRHEPATRRCICAPCNSIRHHRSPANPSLAAPCSPQECDARFAHRHEGNTSLLRPVPVLPKRHAPTPPSPPSQIPRANSAP